MERGVSQRTVPKNELMIFKMKSEYIFWRSFLQTDLAGILRVAGKMANLLSTLILLIMAEQSEAKRAK